MPELSPEEARAIRSLERLAKRWPRSLTIFGNSGSMVIIRTERGDQPWEAIANIDGIACDGGDADWLNGGDPFGDDEPD